MMPSSAAPLPRVSDYVQWHAERRPHALATILGEQSLTYVQLAERVDAMARALLAAGVNHGDRVATLQTPHPDYLIAFLATASIGAIWLGLNPRYRLDELRRAVIDARPSVLLTRTRIGERSFADEIAALAVATDSLRHLVAFEDEPPCANTTPLASFIAGGQRISASILATARSRCGGQDPCLIVYTSGSSGEPKGALLHHEGIATVSHRQDEAWPVNPHRIINYFPINHVGCVVDCTMPCLIAGGTLIFMEQFEPDACLQLMARHQVTIWGSVPSVFQMQLALETFDQYDLRSVQLIVWGGAAMPEPIVQRLRTLCPRLGTNYGMTETCGTITTVEPTDDVEILTTTVGIAPRGIELRLCAADGTPAAMGTSGEVQVRSRSNLLGYWNRPDATAAAFTADGFFRTGDLAVQRPDGRMRLIGRLSEMYKSGGYNVYPREVEAVLESHPAIALAAVIGVPDPLWQEVGIGYLLTHAPLTIEEAEAYCRSRLAAYKIPKRLFIVSELPLLPIGKVDKAALRAQWAAGPEKH